MKKKILSIVISFALIVATSVCIFAFTDDKTPDNVMVTYFESGDSLAHSATEENLVENFDIEYSLSNDGLKIWGTIENTEFSVSGTVLTKNYYGNALIYEANEATGNLDVECLNVARELEEVVMMSANLIEWQNYENVILLTLKLPDAEEFFFVEIYLEDDFHAQYCETNDVVHDWHKTDSLYWFMKYAPCTYGKN